MIAVKTKGKMIKNSLFKHVYIFLYIDFMIAVKTKGNILKIPFLKMSLHFIYRFVNNDCCKNKGKY